MDGEFFTVDVSAGEIVLRVNKFSDYAIGSMNCLSAFGTVKYPKVSKSVGYLRAGTNGRVDNRSCRDGFMV